MLVRILHFPSALLQAAGPAGHGRRNRFACGFEKLSPFSCGIYEEDIKTQLLNQ